MREWRATTAERTDQAFVTAPMPRAFKNLFRRWTIPFTITGITLLTTSGQ